MTNERINVNCPKCGETLVVMKPEKPGMYQLTCSKCKQPFKMQLRGVPIKTEAEGKQDETPTENRKRVKVLGEPKLLANGKYRIDEPAIVKHPYGCICPTCKHPVIFLPQQTGMQAVKCTNCSTMIAFKAVSDANKAATMKEKIVEKNTDAQRIDSPQEEKPTIRGRLRGNNSLGMLSWGKLFLRKKHILCEGKTLIGRCDPDRPSDIEFKDKKMSRQSVEIDVSKNENGYFFKLTVRKAMNPVYVNYKELAEGESIYLKYNDCIQLGNTLINFTKVKA